MIKHSPTQTIELKINLEQSGIMNSTANILFVLNHAELWGQSPWKKPFVKKRSKNVLWKDETKNEAYKLSNIIPKVCFGASGIVSLV